MALQRRPESRVPGFCPFLASTDFVSRGRRHQLGRGSSLQQRAIPGEAPSCRLLAGDTLPPTSAEHHSTHSV